MSSTRTLCGVTLRCCQRLICGTGDETNFSLASLGSAEPWCGSAVMQKPFWIKFFERRLNGVKEESLQLFSPSRDDSWANWVISSSPMAWCSGRHDDWGSWSGIPGSCFFIEGSTCKLNKLARGLNPWFSSCEVRVLTAAPLCDWAEMCTVLSGDLLAPWKVALKQLCSKCILSTHKRRQGF